MSFQSEVNEAVSRGELVSIDSYIRQRNRTRLLKYLLIFILVSAPMTIRYAYHTGWVTGFKAYPCPISRSSK